MATTTPSSNNGEKKQPDAVLLSPTVIRNRLDAGLAIAGGARGSFAKAVTSSTSAPADDTSAAAAAAAIVDLDLFRIEMTKLFLIHRRNQDELERLRARATTSAVVSSTSSSSSNDLPTLRQQRIDVQHTAACLSEYEALAKVIVEKHTVSEHALQRDCAALEQQTTQLQAKSDRTRTEAKLRASQFHHLQQCILDLRSSLSEPLELEATELQETKREREEEQQARSSQAEPTKMDVDDEEEGELYGDLDT